MMSTGLVDYNDPRFPLFAAMDAPLCAPAIAPDHMAISAAMAKVLSDLCGPIFFRHYPDEQNGLNFDSHIEMLLRIPSKLDFDDAAKAGAYDGISLDTFNWQVPEEVKEKYKAHARKHLGRVIGQLADAGVASDVIEANRQKVEEALASPKLWAPMEDAVAKTWTAARLGRDLVEVSSTSPFRKDGGEMENFLAPCPSADTDWLSASFRSFLIGHGLAPVFNKKAQEIPQGQEKKHVYAVVGARFLAMRNLSSLFAQSRLAHEGILDMAALREATHTKVEPRWYHAIIGEPKTGFWALRDQLPVEEFASRIWNEKTFPNMARFLDSYDGIIHPDGRMFMLKSRLAERGVEVKSGQPMPELKKRPPALDYSI